MNYDFDTLTDRRGTDCVKWDCLKDFFGYDDILPMWVADMDFLSVPPAADAVRKRAEHGIYGYTDLSESFYKSVINWMSARHGWDIKKDWILFSPGVVPSINMAVMAYTRPGDCVLIQPPVYPPFYAAINNNKRNLVKNPLKLENGRYTMDFEDLEKKLKTGIKMAILCSPHNPVGRVWSREELKTFGELCVKYNTIIVSDEIHSDLVYKGREHTPIASICESFAQNTITCTASSKTFNIAGLCTSTVTIPNRELYEGFLNVIKCIGLTLGNVFGITAAEAAYNFGSMWLDELLKYLEGSLDYLLSFLKERVPGIKAERPEGTYLVWLDCRELGLNQKDLVRFMLEKAKVGLNDGTEYGPEGQGFMRMNIACPRKNLEEGLRRIENAVNNL